MAEGETSDQSRTLKPGDEATLVGRAVQRDAEAYLRLSEAYLDRIYRHLYYRVASTSEAEDLTEQVFWTGWEGIARDDLRSTPFGVWLYRLAQTLVTDYNCAPRVPKPLDSVARSTLDVAEIVGALTGALTVAEVPTALAGLRTEHQQVIVLRFIEEVSLPMVSQILGTSDGATRQLQHRALLALGRVLSARETT
jgi:RNA polymerase sigma-70 factor (ECF subfamily)